MNQRKFRRPKKRLQTNQSFDSGKLPHDLITAIKNIYEPTGMKITIEPKRETESIDYEACRFGLNGYHVAFRTAKTTPTKIGQFVTIWKREKSGDTILPFDNNDELDFVIVNVSDATHRGQFVFDREVLLEKNIMSRNNKGGKRAIRVYPPWSKPASKVALNTQKWQLPYFFFILPERTADKALVRKLFKI